MDNQRCPMCGKENPEELELCSFCGARLKPLHNPSSESQPLTPGTGTDEESEEPEWLRSLREEPERGWLEDLRDPGQTGEFSEDEVKLQPDEPGEFSSDPAVEDATDPGEALPPGRPAETPSNEAGEPGWLQRVRSLKQEEEATPDNAGSIAEEDPLPEWLTSGAKAFPADLEQVRPLESALPYTVEEEVEPVPFDSLYGEELPAWLSGMTPGEESGADRPELEPLEDPSEEAGSVESDLTPAELPTWLEAMRPVESVADVPPPDEGQPEAELAGPLSGLKGVLPAESGISQVAKPPHYTAKLHVTESNAANAALLTEMLETEGEPHPVPRRTTRGSPALLRVGIAFLLTTAVLWSLLTGAPIASRPSVPAEVGVVSSLVEGVVQGDPVLLAVDYEPGFAGEMEAAAASLVDHLMERGAHLTLVSASVSGPATAERLIQVSQRSRASVESTLPYSNLGFLPGGSAGLQTFAQDPRQTLPFLLDPLQSDVPAWDGGPLGMVQSLSDFALAVVITEDADRARAWIEQVGPSLGETPLVMVVSAQAEPIIRSYYSSNPQQVDGFLSGLAAGASYEDLNGRMGPGGTAWNAFSVGSLAAVGLALLGGLANLLLNAFTPRRRRAHREERS